LVFGDWGLGFGVRDWLPPTATLNPNAYTFLAPSQLSLYTEWFQAEQTYGVDT